MEKLNSLLMNYFARDSVVRICQYGSKLVAGLIKNEQVQNQLLTVSAALSNCRIVQRLFDDVIIFKYTLQSLQNQDKDWLSRLPQLIKTGADQLYFVFEHLAWATQNNLIAFYTPAFWWMICISLWACSLFMNLLRSLLTLIKLKAKKRVIKVKLSGKNEYRDDKLASMDVLSFEEKRSLNMQLKDISSEESSTLLNMIRCGCDFCNAIHYMPAGSILWAGGLSPLKEGFFGTVSSLILILSRL